MKIERIETILVDIPVKRAHKLAFATVTEQNYAVVFVHAGGLVGVGEAATIGGPRWGDESTEGIKSTIDTYIAPVLIGQDASNLNAIEDRLAKSVRGNAFARAAVCMAVHDLAARARGIGVAELLGGVIEPSIELAWTLASGSTERDIAEGEEALALRRHRHFKIKIGFGDPDADTAHVVRLAEHFAGRASVRIDVNQAWDEMTAKRLLPRMAAAGVAMAEQPLPKWNIDGMSRLTAASSMAIMADEGVASSHEAIAHVRQHAADAVALKVTKSGGYAETRRIAGIAQASGLALYGGCMLETAIGTAAYLQLFATLPRMAFGCELFGAMLLKDTITISAPAVSDFCIHVPEGAGIGVEIDSDKLAFYRRDRTARPKALAAE